MRRALRDRALELGTYGALGKDLGVSASTARRLTLQGPPKRWSTERLVAYASELLRRAAATEAARDPAAKLELERRRKRPVYAEAACVAAAAGLVRALGELEKRRPCERGGWSPRAELARQLDVPSVRVGRWIAAGKVPAEFMPAYGRWAEERALDELRKQSERGPVEQLIAEAKKPERQTRLSTDDDSRPAKYKARAPDVQSHEGRTESEEHSGYQWVRRIEAWSDFPLVNELYRWALSRRHPKGMLVGRFWIVTALCSIYHPRGRSIGKKRSPGAVREFDRPVDKQRGSNLSLNVPVSSRTVKRGGLERAARLFLEAMTEEQCEQEHLYVHCIIVRSWRDRTPAERKNYRDRLLARLDNEAALRQRAAQRQHMKIRSRAKKKALARRGSGADSGAPLRPRAPLGARARRNKTS